MHFNLLSTHDLGNVKVKKGKQTKYAAMDASNINTGIHKHIGGRRKGEEKEKRRGVSLEESKTRSF